MLNRRQFLGTAAAGLAAAESVTGESPAPTPSGKAPASGLQDRMYGLLLGGFIGDALGGPIEFQAPEAVARLSDPPRRWVRGERLDAAAAEATKARLLRQWRSYADLRPVPEPYAHWSASAPAGTITDDSRHKLVLLEALRLPGAGGELDARLLAQAYLEWPVRPEVRARPGWNRLLQDWLTEWWYAARWLQGERDLARARPPERMWNGLATCCGQMTSLPLAAIYAGAPTHAYEAAFQLGFFDNGWGRDLNAALVAGLAAALTVPNGSSKGAAWRAVSEAMRTTDPYGHSQIPWCERSVDRWLGVAGRLVRESDREPARLFEGLDQVFRDTVKWEAQVPFVVVAACWELADGDPLVALALTLEWGHDTDSYAQIAGALAGALHGPELFPVAWKKDVEARLEADYGVRVGQEVELLARLHSAAQVRSVIAGVPLIPG
jgi:ADP-ribosylglycohydrolase